MFFSTGRLASSQDSPKDHAAWWIENFGVVTPKDNPLAGRAEQVFARVSAAADKKGSRVPRLVIMKGTGDPWAQAIKDGGVIITEGALTLCYHSVTPDRGDSRLAFILGHELAHLAKDDFWHNFAFTAVKEYADDRETRKALMSQLKETSELIRTKELQADSYGLVYMTIAGYDPKSIIDDTTNFIEDWVSQIMGKVAYTDEKHPSSKERAEALRAQLREVANDLDLFTFGVRLYQLGRYSDAILLFDTFREKFAGREVFNNIGLSHYQLSVKALAGCDESSALRFKLSTILDPDTLAKGFRSRGAAEATCFEDPLFQEHIKEAIRHFELAMGKDLTYMPARINLMSALILSGEYSKAMGVADEALRITPGSIETLNNKAVALYLFGKSNTIDTADNAIGILKGVLNKEPSLSEALYNIASIQAERSRNASAQDTWRQFLTIEPTGVYADNVRKKSGIKTGKKKIAGKAVLLKPPFPLGEIGTQGEKRLKDTRPTSFAVGKFSGEIYELGEIKLLVIDGSVEIVETIPDTEVDISKFKKNTGEPVKVIKGLYSASLIYDNFAVDVMGGKVKKIIYFARELR